MNGSLNEASQVGRSDWLKSPWHVAVIAILLVYITAARAYLALHLDAAVPPDEVTHVGRCEAFSHTWLRPVDGPESYRYGLISRTPYLYYYLMGRVLDLRIGGGTDLTWLRLSNVVLSLLTAMVGWRWFCLTTENRLAQVVFVVLLTNTLMWLVLGASVNYDNLVNLLAACALYCLHRYLKNPAPSWLGMLGVSVLAGTLTKITFAPLAGVLFVLLVFHSRHRLAELLRDVWRVVVPGQKNIWVVTAGLAALMILNAELYGRNLAQYGRLVPRPEQVLAIEHCLENRIFARGYTAREFRLGHLTWDQAMAFSDRIDHPEDRKTAQEMLAWSQLRKEGSIQMLPLTEYVQPWLQSVLEGLFGFGGHLSVHPSMGELWAFGIWICAAFAVWLYRFADPSLRRFDLAHPTRFLYDALALVVVYTLVLLIYNYRVYLETAHPNVGVQGRYLLIVLVPACGFLAHYLICYFPRVLQVTVALAIMARWILGGLPFLLAHTTKAWWQ